MMPSHRKCCMTHRSSNVLGKQLNCFFDILIFYESKQYRVCHTVSSKIKGIKIPPLSQPSQSKRLNVQIEDSDGVDMIDMKNNENGARKCTKDDESRVPKFINDVLGIKPQYYKPYN